MKFFDGETDSPQRDKRTCWYRLTHASPFVYLFLILLLLLLVVLFIILLAVIGGTGCDSNGAGQTGRNPFSMRRKVKPSGPYLATDGSKFPYQKIRLPASVIPVLYDLYLHPNVTVPQPYFFGNVSILCVCKSPTDKVILHVKNLTIAPEGVRVLDSAGVLLGGGGPGVKESPTLEQLYIPLDRRECRKGEEIRVNIEFKGVLLKTLVGFYLSEYKKNGKKM